MIFPSDLVSPLRRAPAACRFLFVSLVVGCTGCAVAQTPPAAATGCAPVGAVQMPAGVDIARINLLDEGKLVNIYTSTQAADDRDAGKSFFAPGVSKLVDVSPSGLNRLLMDTMLRSRRFKVYEMRSNVTAEHSDVLITAQVIDAHQLLLPALEGGRRVTQSSVKLSLQVKNMYTGENILTSDAMVEGSTGFTTGKRTVLTSADDPNSPEVQSRLAADFKLAMFGAFEKAGERVESLLRPMGRLVSAEACSLDLFGGSRVGLQAGDELVVFRSQRKQLGETVVFSNTKVVALARCSGVGTDTSQCSVVRSVAGLQPQEGDFAVVTDESMRRAREH